MCHRVIASAVLLFSLATAMGAEGESLIVLPEKIDGVPPRDMMKKVLLDRVMREATRWRSEYEARKTPEQIEANSARLRQRFLQAIGGVPERTPLNPQITGTLHREGYRVEKVIFESRPRFYVTATLFVPESDRFKPPYPGVLIPCGHAPDAKAHVPYQTMGASLAWHGMVALAFDPIDQGERYQLLDEQGKPRIGGTSGHTMIGVGSALLGGNTASFEIWDGMRAIDYLQSRPEVDPKRIGCTGNSGGGTQTSDLMALDDRIAAAAPSCYLTNLPTLIRTIGPQDAEQNIFGQLAFGMDHADYITMRAPRPVLICAATKDFFDIGGTWQTFRDAKRLYTRIGYPERIDLMENDASHNYDKDQRQAVLRWMARWLQGRDEPLTEPAIQPLTEQEIRSTPGGQVMLIQSARTVYDINEDEAERLAPSRSKAWSGPDHATVLERVRALAGIRKLSELGKPAVQKVGQADREGYSIEKLIFKPDDGVYLPALEFIPSKGQPKRSVLYLQSKGAAADAGLGGPIERLVKGGAVVMAVDVRGLGETQQTKQTGLGPAVGTDWQDVFTAYLLGRSYVGMRAEDILVCARYLAEEHVSAGGLALVAVGNVGVPALHAAALEPQLFESVKLIGSLVSFTNVIESRFINNQQVNVVQGALEVYDLPDLLASLGGKVRLEHPVDAAGKPAKPD